MSDRSVGKRLEALEHRMALLEALEHRQEECRPEPTPEYILELLTILGEIAVVNNRSYPEDLEQLLGLDRERAVEIAEEFAPLVASRMDAYPHGGARLA